MILPFERPLARLYGEVVRSRHHAHSVRGLASASRTVLCCLSSAFFDAHLGWRRRMHRSTAGFQFVVGLSDLPVLLPPNSDASIPPPRGHVRFRLRPSGTAAAKGGVSPLLLANGHHAGFGVVRRSCRSIADAVASQGFAGSRRPLAWPLVGTRRFPRGRSKMGDRALHHPIGPSSPPRRCPGRPFGPCFLLPLSPPTALRLRRRQIGLESIARGTRRWAACDLLRRALPTLQPIFMGRSAAERCSPQRRPRRSARALETHVDRGAFAFAGTSGPSSSGDRPFLMQAAIGVAGALTVNALSASPVDRLFPSIGERVLLLSLFGCAKVEPL